MKTIGEKIRALAESGSALGKIGLLIVENEKDPKTALVQAKKVLAGLQYRECADYVALMDALSAGKKKLFYVEPGKRLDGLVLEIVAEFEAGLVSLADRKNKTGLKTARFNPSSVSLVAVLTRSQIEKSHPRLFEYVNLTQAI